RRLPLKVTRWRPCSRFATWGSNSDSACKLLARHGWPAMETTLHRQLKQSYAGGCGRQEVRIGTFRIDAQAGDHLIEVQLGSLAAIRAKIQQLLADHRVCVVKPLVAAKWLIIQPQRGQKGATRRKSPKSESWIDLIHELVYFVNVFPHPHLTLEVPWIHVEE